MRIKQFVAGALCALLLAGGWLSSPVGAQQIMRIYGTVGGVPIALLANSSGVLRVSLDGGSIPASTCAAPALNETGFLTTGIAFTAVPAVSISVAGTCIVTATATAFTSTVPGVFPNGSLGSPSVVIGQDGNGWFRNGATEVVGSVGGGAAFGWGTSGGVAYGQIFGNEARLYFSGDTIIQRDNAANTLAQRNGTNAQSFRVYNTVSGGDSEFLSYLWSSNIAYIGTEKTGAGTARAFRIQTAGSGRWEFTASDGHMLAVTDNVTDIGASGATRPRTVYAGTSVVAPAYTVGATAGASGTCASATVVNGIVTVCTP